MTNIYIYRHIIWCVYIYIYNYIYIHMTPIWSSALVSFWAASVLTFQHKLFATRCVYVGLWFFFASWTFKSHVWYHPPVHSWTFKSQRLISSCHEPSNFNVKYHPVMNLQISTSDIIPNPCKSRLQGNGRISRHHFSKKPRIGLSLKCPKTSGAVTSCQDGVWPLGATALVFNGAAFAMQWWKVPKIPNNIQ